MVETILNGKYRLILPEHRAARPEWKTGWEVERIESMMSNLSEGDLVLDIGTEEGDISAILAQRTGRIILFEPNERVWSNIKAIWTANKLPDPVDVYVGFASNNDDFRGKHYINRNIPDPVFPKCADGELISDHGFKELKDSGDIPQIKIDTFIKPEHGRVSLITIDVEGSEYEVLKGAEQTIRRDKPHIYVSVHPIFMADQYGQNYHELRDFVLGLGYKEEYLTYDHELHIHFKPLIS